MQPIAGPQAETAASIPQDPQGEKTGKETPLLASGDHRARDWLFAHPEAVDLAWTIERPVL